MYVQLRERWLRRQYNIPFKLIIESQNLKTMNRAIFKTVLILVILSSGILGCDSNESLKSSAKVFVDSKDKSTFNLNDQQALNSLAKILSKETGAFELLEDAKLIDLRDSKGDYKAISVRYQVGKIITKMVVPVNEVALSTTGLKASKNGNESAYYMLDTEACEMKCVSVYPCSSCTQEIIERCKSQTCSCNNMSEGCSAHIIFND